MQPPLSTVPAPPVPEQAPVQVNTAYTGAQSAVSASCIPALIILHSTTGPGHTSLEAYSPQGGPIGSHGCLLCHSVPSRFAENHQFLHAGGDPHVWARCHPLHSPEAATADQRLCGRHSGQCVCVAVLCPPCQQRLLLQASQHASGSHCGEH